MTEPVSSSLPTCRDLIQSIVAAVDARDVYTAHHSDRVAAMAVVLARVLHLSEDDTTTVQVAAFAHDIGKISPQCNNCSKSSSHSQEHYELQNPKNH